MAEIILHGVGKGQLLFKSGKVLTLAKAQNLTIETSVSEESVFGGDSLYSLLDYITEKDAKLTIKDALFSLEGIEAATGSAVGTGAEVWVDEDLKTPAAGTCTLSKTSGVIVDTVVCLKADGTPLTRIASGDPEATQFVVTAAGVVTVDETVTSELNFSYFYTDATGSSVQILEDDVPGVAEFRYSILTDQMDDGHRYQISIRAYKCKATGAYTFGAERGSAFAPEMEMKVLNANRTDKKVLSYNVSIFS